MQDTQSERKNSRRQAIQKQNDTTKERQEERNTDGQRDTTARKGKEQRHKERTDN